MRNTVSFKTKLSKQYLRNIAITCILTEFIDGNVDVRAHLKIKKCCCTAVSKSLTNRCVVDKYVNLMLLKTVNTN